MPLLNPDSASFRSNGGSDDQSGVCLTLAYDGHAYHGWQYQEGLPTIQQALAEAVASMNGGETLIRGASRTDAGVHALGQRAAFRARNNISDDGWLRGLGTKLPRDIVVHAVARCPADYDPRFDAHQKWYRYLVDLGRFPNPLIRGQVWHLGHGRAHTGMRRRNTDRASELLDLDAMRSAASTMHGTHDFIAFKASSDDRENTVRTLHEVRIETPFEGKERLLAIHVRGDAFLKHMVRVIAGTLVEVGRGRMGVEHVRALLAGGARPQAGETAPAQGLCLMRIELKSIP